MFVCQAITQQRLSHICLFSGRSPETALHVIIRSSDGTRHNSCLNDFPVFESRQLGCVNYTVSLVRFCVSVVTFKESCSIPEWKYLPNRGHISASWRTDFLLSSLGYWKVSGTVCTLVVSVRTSSHCDQASAVVSSYFNFNDLTAVLSY
jgi:hypothetical protein